MDTYAIKNNRWIDLSKLPKRGKIISWKNSIGYTVPFKYGDVEGNIFIEGYKECQTLIIIYKDKKYEIKTGNFTQCHFGRFIDTPIFFEKNIGDVVVAKNCEYTILKQIYITKNKKRLNGYRYQCNQCGYIDEDIESLLLSGRKQCPVCCNNPRIVIPEINSIVANPENHWMIPYFQGGYDEAKLYTIGSGKKVDLICPDCGKIKNQPVRYLYYDKTLRCDCGDGISYPNKFLYSLLNQLNINYISEYNFTWTNMKRYDIYIQNLQLIIENHGSQHYKPNSSFQYCGGRNLKEEQQNDQYKKELAIHNNIKYYIEIDCRKSELNWIKDSVMNSELPNLLHFKEDDIDWLECERYALKNIVKEVCDYKKGNEFTTVEELANRYKLSVSTIYRYLKIGKNFGWCSHDDLRKLKAGRTSRKIYCVENNMFFKSASAIQKNSLELFGISMLANGIRECCRGECIDYKGYHFKYITEELCQYNVEQLTQNTPLSA